MLFAREVQELLGAYPGRDFRMLHICRYIIGKSPDHKRRKAVREAVRVVLIALEESGVLERTPATKNGGYALYRWKSAR